MHNLLTRLLTRALRTAGYEVRRAGQPRKALDEKRQATHEQLRRDVAARKVGA